MSKLPEPYNATEQYLHGINVRLDALCHMVSSLIEHIAEKEGIATTNNKTSTRTPARKKQVAKEVKHEKD